LVWLGATLRSATEPNPLASPSASADAWTLVDEGATLELAAVDTEGRWGTVTVQRGPDRGGYRAVANFDLDPGATDVSGMFFHNDPDHFYVEFQVAYAADRSPVADVGRDDWLLIGADGDFIAPISVSVLEPELMMGTEASDIVSTPLTGRLVFAVPRDLAGRPLSLVYEPGMARLVVREPGPPPAAVPDPRPPAPVDYVQREGSPITVIDSASADALFTEVRTCTDPAAGFSIDYPATWTAVASEETPCARFEPPGAGGATRSEVVSLWMGPAGASVQVPGQALPGAAESIAAVGELPASRNEVGGAGGGFMDPGSLQYAYLIGLDSQMPNVPPFGRTLILETAWNLDLDPEAYRERKAVMDRMAASLVVAP
jgi:hypothetical protein